MTVTFPSFLRPAIPPLKRFLATRLKKPLGAWVFAAGALMTLGFAPFGLWPLAVISLALLITLVRQAISPRQAAAAALVWGMGHQLTALYWLPWAFYKDANDSLSAAILGGIPALLGLALYGALGYALAALLARLAPIRARAALLALLLLLLEFIKGLSPLGFPWLPIGAVWAPWVSMIQLAHVGGVYLLSLLVLVLAMLASQPCRQTFATAAILAAAVFSYGMLRLQQPIETTGNVIRVVQPNVQSALKWDPELRQFYLQRTLTMAYHGKDIPPTIILPETAVPFYLEHEDDVRTIVASGLPARGMLLTGTVRRDEAPATFATRYYNSMVALDSQARIEATLDKHLLVPFGEFIPARALLDLLPLPAPIRTLSQSRLDYSAGETPPLLPSPAGTALGLICYEGIFPLYVAAHAAKADYLANITNDNWFTGTIALAQHASLARLRAVETGLPLVRVANTGITVVFDPLGREVLRLPANRAVTADIILPKGVGGGFFAYISSHLQ